MTFCASKSSLSGLPLHSVPVVVLDTETTGLDTQFDRIIEVGAVRVRDGEILGEPFSELVNPSMPIPSKSSEIHGLFDHDVESARDFADVFGDFSKWVDDDVVVGYSLGFDLAIFEAEHKRREMTWRAPRCLDVRHLVQLVAPDLPEQSLEMAASWLGIEISSRHRAYGDAQATAEIFIALLPKLHAKGISTLAQAERACLSLGSRLNAESQAGWHEVVASDPGHRAGTAALARIDSYPYRHRVLDVMHAPAKTVTATMPLKDVLAMLINERISSVFVAPSDTNDAWGILTERDILRAVNAEGAQALDQNADAYTVRPLVDINENEFVYRAITKMSSRNFRHLGVVDESENLVGALSARDLLKQRAGDAMSLGDTIDAADSTAELGKIWESLTTVAGALVQEDVDPRNIAAIISHELRALTRRATELAEQQMQAEELGTAPMPYAMLVLGSGGRGESLLAMDQDNAIVYQSGAPGSDVDKWFEQLGTITADILDSVGVCYCKGGIMAKNAEWRMDVARWQQTVESWIAKGRPEDLMNCDIFFDAMPVHGDDEMGNALRRDAIALAGQQKLFLKNMAIKAANFSNPLGWFGRVRTDAGRLDLKMSGIMPIFSAARVLALQHGLHVRATPERLEAARDLDVPGAHIINNLIDAHRIMLGSILRQQLRDIEAGVKLSNKVALSELDNHERDQLKWSLQQSSGIADLIGAPTPV